MKPKYVALLWVLMLMQPVILAQDDEPSAYMLCRMVVGKDLIDPKAPSFSAYPATTGKVTLTAKLDLASNRLAREFRTVIREQIAKGPNFAGHYRVAVWGCGSSCAQFAVVNLKTGKVIAPAGSPYTSAVDFDDTDDFLKDELRDWGLGRFTMNSRLLVVIGALNEDESKEGAFYYVLKGERLVPVHSTIVKKNCGDLPR